MEWAVWILGFDLLTKNNATSLATGKAGGLKLDAD